MSTDQHGQAASSADGARYGRGPSTIPRWFVITAAVLGAIVFGIVAIGGVRMLNPDTEGTLVRFKAIDDNTVTATVTVRKPDADRAVCTLRARDLRGEAVGSADIVVEPDGEATVTREFPTTSRAVVVDVLECTSSAPTD